MAEFKLNMEIILNVLKFISTFSTTLITVLTNLERNIKNG